MKYLLSAFTNLHFESSLYFAVVRCFIVGYGFLPSLFLGPCRYLLQFIKMSFLQCQTLPSYGRSFHFRIICISVQHCTKSSHMCNSFFSCCSDFLTRSYDIGGVISVMALSGLFILMTQHGLEYPKFYEKLYALLTPAVFMAKHRSVFLQVSEKKVLTATLLCLSEYGRSPIFI